MGLQTSGAISLNDFNTELQTSGQISLNDAAVRDLIGKASGAQNAMNEYYGASASDAVDRFNPQDASLGEWRYWSPGSVGSSPYGRKRSGSQANASGVHTWPVASDGKPYAIGPDHYPLGGGKNRYDWSMNHGCWSQSGSHQNSVNVRSSGNTSSGVGDIGTGVLFPSEVSSGWKYTGAVFHLQKITPGSNRFRANIKAGPMQMGYSDRAKSNTVVSLIEWENCTPVDAYHAVGTGAKKVTTLFNYTGPQFSYDPMSNPSGSTGSWEQDMNTVVNTTYEWLFIEVYHGTQTQRTQSFDTKLWSVNA